MITIYDIAEKCGISPSTVSKVINGYASISEATKSKVLKAMKELNYIPNNNAKFLSGGSSNNVGILAYFGMDISPFKHTFFTDILDSFQMEMNANNYDLLFISRTVGGKTGTFYENCISRQVDGVLLFGDMLNPEIQEIICSDIPRIGFDYMGDKMSGVFSDNYRKTLVLTEHLLNYGHKDIVFIYGDKNMVTDERIRGFKDALDKHGIKLTDDMLYSSKYLDSKDIFKLTEKILSREKIPTAIMYPDDYLAAQGLKVLESHGLKCPENISITGFDGINIASLVSPTLTTIKQDTVAIGKVLATRLIDYMKNKSDVVNELVMVNGTLIIGESTGPAKVQK